MKFRSTEVRTLRKMSQWQHQHQRKNSVLRKEVTVVLSIVKFKVKIDFFFFLTTTAMSHGDLIRKIFSAKEWLRYLFSL